VIGWGPGRRGAAPCRVRRRAMVVVEGLELAQRVDQVGVVPDQGAAQELTPAGLHPPFHDRIHPRNADAAGDNLDASAANTASKAAVNFESRSRIRYLAVAPAS
jgi:hypothetical protein